MSENIDALIALWPRFADGIVATLQLTIGGSVLALLLAALLGITAREPNVLARGAARVFIESFRGTSLPVQPAGSLYDRPLFFPALVCTREVPGLLAGMVVL